METNRKEEKALAAGVPGEDRVELFLPKGYVNDEPNHLIGVNGVNYLLPKGKTSLVPRAVRAEFERSRRAEEMLDRRSSQMQEASR